MTAVSTNSAVFRPSLLKTSYVCNAQTTRVEANLHEDAVLFRTKQTHSGFLNECFNFRPHLVLLISRTSLSKQVLVCMFGQPSINGG